MRKILAIATLALSAGFAFSLSACNDKKPTIVTPTTTVVVPSASASYVIVPSPSKSVSVSASPSRSVSIKPKVSVSVSVSPSKVLKFSPTPDEYDPYPDKP